MTTLQEKLSYFDRQQFDKDNGEIAEFMITQLVGLISTAIADGKTLFEQLRTSYKEYYQKGFNMELAFQKEYKRYAHTVKGQANLCYVKKMSDSMASLQKAIESNNKDNIDKYTYEVFAFKKKYFECLFAVKGENVEEPEFDLREFDEFTHLSFAPLYQSIPINSNILTFNRIGSQSVVNNMDINGIGNTNNQRKSSLDLTKNRVLISQNENVQVEIIKPNKEKSAAPPANSQEEQGNLINLGEIKVNDSPQSLYTYSIMEREKGEQLFMFRKPQISYEDLPIDSQLTCSIF